jgi:hypothetical protein
MKTITVTTATGNTVKIEDRAGELHAFQVKNGKSAYLGKAQRGKIQSERGMIWDRPEIRLAANL